MDDSNLKTSIHKNFEFLIDDFNFKLTSELYNQGMGNAIVVFCKDKNCIEIVRDRGQILITFYDSQLQRSNGIEFTYVIQYFSKNDNPVYLFPSVYNDEMDEMQVSRLAHLMYEWCKPILTGDLTVLQLKALVREIEEKGIRNILDMLSKAKRTD